MKPGLLLLAVSVVCLLSLAPASPFSQRVGVIAGRDTETADGAISPAEWEKAVWVSAIFSPTSSAPSPNPGRRAGEASSAAQPAPTVAYLINDGTDLRVAVAADLDGIVADEDWWYSQPRPLFTSVFLLCTGFAGLAGYATFRWKVRR